VTLSPTVDGERIALAVRVLQRAALVAFPTETVYGLGADADCAGAVGKIFEVKGRPAEHPLIVHLACAAAVGAWAREIPPAAQSLIDAFWPGPLTLVLARSDRALDIVTGGQDTVGLRCPSHPWAQALLQSFAAARSDAAAAVAAPSANRYGHLSPTCADHVREDLGEGPGRVELILDGGACPLGIESTIVDFPMGRARVLRPGSIRADQLLAVLGEPAAAPDPTSAAPRVSGRVAGHYAPRTPLELVDTHHLARRLEALQPQALGVLGMRHTLRRVVTTGARLVLEAHEEPERYAHDLYDQLHRLDRSHLDRILVELPPLGTAWEAVHDRLGRAATGSGAGLDDAD
jgi:L-threonylcarbamoyladenylate synthase